MPAPDASVFRLRDHFLFWQCRIRQHAMRMEGGRPPAGARPRVEDAVGAPLAEAVTLLIVRRAPQDDAAQFQHMARRTHDPAERYRQALEYLCADYYQQPRDFSDVLYGLFDGGGAFAARLLEDGQCVLCFAQFAQVYRIPCAVAEAPADHPAWAATYWHNALFNPSLPADARILGFKPRWAEATADPAPG